MVMHLTAEWSSAVYGMWSLMSDFFHLAYCFQGSPMFFSLCQPYTHLVMHLTAEWLSAVYSILQFPGGSYGKASACSAGDPGSVLGLGRSLGEGNGTPLQYSCLENSMDKGAMQDLLRLFGFWEKCLCEFMCTYSYLSSCFQFC